MGPGQAAGPGASWHLRDHRRSWTSVDGRRRSIDAGEGRVPPVEFRLLGRLEVVGCDGPIELRGSKRRALTALLLVERGRAVPVDRVVRHLWDDDPDAGGRVKSTIHELRRLFGADGDRLVTSGSGYSLRVKPGELDVSMFEETVASAAATPDRRQAVTLLSEALAHWRGGALEEFTDADWAAGEAARLDTLRLRALEDLVDAELDIGSHTRAVARLEGLVVEHPTREHLWGQLMVALYRCGRQAEALRAYRRLRVLLAEELGISPSPALVDLDRRVLAQDPSLDWSPPQSYAHSTSSVASSSPNAPQGREHVDQTSLVTIVFVDLVESTALAERLGDDRADALCRQALTSISGAVDGWGGEVVKELGDGSMSAFTSALAAVRAGAETRDALAELRSSAPDTPSIRVGISSGEAARRSRDWSGRPVIEASRLCDAAAPGEVLVSELTRRLVGSRGRLSFGELRRLRLKGFDEPVSALTLLDTNVETAADPDGNRSDIRQANHQAGTFVPVPRHIGGTLALVEASKAAFVGRTRELASAANLLEDVVNGGSQTTLLVGEPGVGKTRLASAIAAAAASRGFAIAYGRCDEGLAAPFRPLVDALTPWLFARVDSLAHELRSAADPLLVLWPDLADRLSCQSENSNVEPEIQRWRLFEAIAEVVRSTAADGPLLIVLDDLQWAEPSTVQLLSHLVRKRLPRTAFVGTMRAPDAAKPPNALLGDLGTEHPIEVIELAGLDAHAVSELVALRVGERPPDSLSARLQEHTDGNPFFVGALLRHLEHTGKLRRDDGSWIKPSEVDAVGVPGQVRGVIEQRLRMLGTNARRVIDVGAVQGAVFDHHTVRGVLDVSQDDALDALEEAVGAGLLREYGPGQFAFVHALIRHAVLDGLLRLRLAHLHWQIARQLERDDHAQSSGMGEIAYHYAAGIDVGDVATVIRTTLSAGDAAMQRLAFEEAAEHYGTALTSLDRAPPDPDVRYRVLTSLGRALTLHADVERAQPLWLEAADIAQRAGDAERMFSALLGYSHRVLFQHDRHDLRLLDGLLRLLPPGDSPLRASALGWSALALMRTGRIRPPEDSRMADEAVAMARRTRDAQALSHTLYSRMYVAADGPDASGMLRDAQELVALRSTPRLGPLVDRAIEDRDLARALLRHGRRQ
jgi:DNA-binding SARP family transcriptional activator